VNTIAKSIATMVVNPNKGALVENMDCVIDTPNKKEMLRKRTLTI
jgi:hypothetical protein